MEVEKMHLWIKWCTALMVQELINDNAPLLGHDATSNLMGILAIYKDGFVFCGNDLFRKNLIAEVKKNIQSWKASKWNI